MIGKKLILVKRLFYGIMQKNDLLYKSGQSLTIKSLGGLIIFLTVNLLTHNLIFACTSIIILNIVTIIIFDFLFTGKKLIDFNENTIKISENLVFLV